MSDEQVYSRDDYKNLLDKVVNLENQIGNLKNEFDRLNEHLVIIRHSLTRMEINENDVIREYKMTKPIESFYTMMSFANNSFLMNTCPDILNNFLYQKYCKLMECLGVYKIQNKHEIVHIGTDSDGGYRVVDNFDRYPNKILYSMGVGGDVSFEEDMANRGFQVYMYDHTVDDTPAHHANFHFFKKGLIGRHNDEYPDLMTLEEMMNANGHSGEQDIFFKCDIEGFEIGVLNETPSEILNKFTEIVMELHNLTNYTKIDEIINALEKLNKTHRLVHVHPNNLSRINYIGDIAISDCIEVTYVRKTDYNCSKMTKYMSGEGCYPCNENLPERIFCYNKQK